MEDRRNGIQVGEEFESRSDDEIQQAKSRQTDKEVDTGNVIICEEEEEKLDTLENAKRNEAMERKRKRRRAEQSSESKNAEAERSRKRRKHAKKSASLEQHQRDRRLLGDGGPEEGMKSVQIEERRSSVLVSTVDDDDDDEPFSSKRIRKVIRERLRRSRQSEADRIKEKERSQRRRLHTLSDPLRLKPMKEKRSEKARELRARQKSQLLAEADRMREIGWRKVNQIERSTSSEEDDVIKKVVEEYKADLKDFQERTHAILPHKVCSICGIRKEIQKIVKDSDDLFECLRHLTDPFPMGSSSILREGNARKSGVWWKFSSPGRDEVPENTSCVCAVCSKSLSSNIVPLKSRASYPIKVNGVPSFLKDLSELEQALISPVLPMILVFQHHGPYGQQKSYGQSIALENDVQRIARTLPCRPEKVCVPVSDKKGVLRHVRSPLIRKALEYFKSNGHPGFVGIKFCEESFEHLCEEVEKDRTDCRTEQTISRDEDDNVFTRLADAG